MALVGSVEGMWVMETVDIVEREMHRKSGQSYTKLEMAMTSVPPGMCVFFHHTSVWAFCSHHSHTALDVCSLLKEKA